MIALGIDPGKLGGFAVVTGVGRSLTVQKMPATEADVWEWFRELGDAKVNVEIAVIEIASARPAFRPGAKACVACARPFQQGQGVSSAFNSGWGYGGLRMALIASGVPFYEVTAAKWCRAHGLKRGPAESNTDWKNRHKALAQRLYPNVTRITHHTADALLIAHYAIRLAAETAGVAG